MYIAIEYIGSQLATEADMNTRLAFEVSHGADCHTECVACEGWWHSVVKLRMLTQFMNWRFRLSQNSPSAN